MTETARTLHIGTGNPLRHDDGVGPWLARALAARGLNAFVHKGDVASLIEAFDTHSDVIVLDATQSGHAPGTITRIDAADGPVPLDVFRHSRQHCGVEEAVETARTLGCLPQTLILVGIEGQTFEPGIGLSPQVEWAACRLLENLCAA